MDKPRIGIDGYNLAMPHGTGVATYGRTLAAAVRDLGWPLDLVYGIPVSPEAPVALRQTLFYGRLSEETGAGPPPAQTLQAKIRRLMLSRGTRDLIEIPKSGHVVTTGFEDRVPEFDRLFTKGTIFNVSARYFRRFRRFMPLKMDNPPAIMHWTYPVPLTLLGSANIYTIHDLVPLRLPYTSLEDKRYYHDLIRTCIETAAHIVTVSEASRRDIFDLFGADPARVTNTYQAFDPPHEKDSDADLTQRLDRLFDLRRDEYFLIFGAIEPKKNLGRLLEAYLRSEVKRPLVIVGSTGWKSEQELRLLRGGSGTDLPGAAQIRQISYLPRRLLLDLVQGARAVLFPSLYEGFGLPALEAIGLGTPLLTSNTSSLPEVVGEAALLVDPYDVGGMVRAIKRLDVDDALRDRLRAAGAPQAGLFSATVYKERVRQLYQTVLND